MKLFKKIMCIGLLATVAISTESCKKILEEHPQSGIVPSFFNSPSGVLGGIAGVYNDIRGQWGTEGFSLFTLGGTDEYLQGASNSAPKFFTYNGLQSADMNGSFWNAAYTDINTLNGVLQFGATIALPDVTRKQYLAQAKFLRAFWYFYLVQTFGDVPLHTTFITVPTTSDSRQPMADVYTQIIKDLTDASTDLPAQVTAPFLGKAAAQGVAKYLLAKVYLTRGWSSAAVTGDFATAYNICQDLITNKATYGFDLWQDYADAFNPANDYGKETMFVSDHSIDTKYGQYAVGGQASGGAAQNLTPWFARWNYPTNATINSYKNGSVIATSGPSMMVRDVPNGRPYIRVRPNSPLQTAGPNVGKSYLFDEAFSDRINDSRYDKTFQTIWMCNLASPLSNASTAANNSRGITYSITPGLDTAVWFTDHEVTGAPQFNGATPFKGVIIPPSLWNNNFFPAVKKFDDPSRAPANFNDPSTRPVVIFRFADVYLIGAEAALKNNNDVTNAALLLNAVRQRAAYRKTNTAGQNAAAVTAVTITPAQVTLDFILDERSREFWGEWQRWWDLARTKSLLTRVPAWNPEASPYIKPFHVLRPIPQSEIDLVTSGPPFPQNQGY